eukprot:CAMPEP_0183369826 /NCGR_PEP_ID=MMETSP0164_2-20130417/100705_1 /TAXON_ID=221442 /ORGANISM="Coccolithus pelagicus ssp braarudi, Strain PLY182g" /LENGTH=187 /DNA_ID=CAMNT_0025546137 /DNA_START=214 /DNA_END=774 /DNA_ORIENTATION=+
MPAVWRHPAHTALLDRDRARKAAAVASGQRGVMKGARDLLRCVHRAKHVDDKDAALARFVRVQPLVGRLHAPAPHPAALLMGDGGKHVRPPQAWKQLRGQRVRGAGLLGVHELATLSPPAAHLEALPHPLVARLVLDGGKHDGALVEVLIAQGAQEPFATSGVVTVASASGVAASSARIASITLPRA